MRAQGKEPKCLVHAWGPASQHGGEMRSCHGLRKQAGQVAGRHSLAQLRLQKALSGSSAVPCSPFNSFQLPLTSKSSSFPAFRVLSHEALEQFLSQRSQLNLREVKCLSQDSRATAIRAMGSDDGDRSHSRTIASQGRNLGHAMLRPPHSRTAGREITMVGI